MLELKKAQVTDYFLSSKSNKVYTSKINPLYTAFLQSIKFCGCKMRIKFNKEPLVVEKNYYATKILNAYIDYDLNTWPNNCLYLYSKFYTKKWLVWCN